MTRITRQSKKEDLWQEVERLRQSAGRERNRAAILESELERVRGEHERLEERARFTEELSERLRAANERLEILNSLTKELASFDLDGVLEVCVQRIPYMVGARFASVYLYEPEADRLVLKHHTHGREIDRVVELSAAPSSLMALAVRGGEPLCIGDLARFAPPEGQLSRPHQERYRTSSCMVAPLLAGGKVQGVLNLADRFDERPFDEGEGLEIVRQACDLLAVSVRNTRLFDEVQRAARADSLTGLLNRQAFAETLDTEIKRALRYENALSILLVKLSGLRLINANHGHQAGDAVLAQAAHRIRRSVRDVDIAGRAGGSTFGLILPEQARSGAQTVAERLAQLLAEARFEVAGESFQLGRTLGVAVYHREGTASDLLQRALEAVDRARAEDEAFGIEG